MMFYLKETRVSGKSPAQNYTLVCDLRETVQHNFFLMKLIMKFDGKIVILLN